MTDNNLTPQDLASMIAEVIFDVYRLKGDSGADDPLYKADVFGGKKVNVNDVALALGKLLNSIEEKDD